MDLNLLMKAPAECRKSESKMADVAKHAHQGENIDTPRRESLFKIIKFEI